MGNEQQLQKILDRMMLGLLDSSQTHASVFLSTIYCNLKFSWDETIPTACTNGKYLKINPSWIQTLSDRMKITLLAHELWHVAYMHMSRMGDRNPMVWNMAGDHAINLMLLAHGYHFDIDPVTNKRMGLADPQFEDMTAEQIYDKLMSDCTQIELPFGNDFESGDGEGELTDIDKSDIMTTVIRAMTMHNMAGKEAGTLPAEFTSMMASLLRPKLRWGNIMDRWLTELSEEGYTWKRPNRRFQDVYLPSKQGQESLTHLIYAIDCSGSMTDEQVRRINSELRGMQDKFTPKSMKIVSFDTIIHDVWEFDRDHQIEPLTIHGRGGTDMTQVFELVKREKPHALVMMSDMWCDIPEKPNGTEVLWICLDNPGWVAPYGKCLHLDSSQDL